MGMLLAGISLELFSLNIFYIHPAYGGALLAAFLLWEPETAPARQAVHLLPRSHPLRCRGGFGVLLTCRPIASRWLARRWVMDTVPLDLQRKCEQRWAARYRRPLEPSATLDHRLDGNACAGSPRTVAAACTGSRSQALPLRMPFKMTPASF